MTPVHRQAGRACLTLSLMSLGACAAVEPPWPPQYKLKPHETSRLTPADVVGPDGIVYPDWRYAGVSGGIPVVPMKVRVGEFGAKPDDGQDDSRAIEEAAAAVAELKDGGAVVLEEGTYHLDRPVVVTGDNVVIRGRGRDRTRLVFRYLPKNDIAFFRPRPGETVGPDSWIEVHADPKGQLADLYLECNGEVVYRIEPRRTANDNFVIRADGKTLVDAAGVGRRTLKAVVAWKNGTKAETSLEVNVDPGLRLPPGQWRYPTHTKASVAALMFVGDKQSGATWELARDGKRGDVEVRLMEAPDLQPGDPLLLVAKHTDRWRKLTHNATSVEDCRRYQFQVKGVAGRRVTLNQPLRIDFPTADESYVQRIFPIRRCGVEDLSLEQTTKLWTTGVLFLNAWECWARGVNVIKCGRYPVFTRYAKWCEIGDCEFTDAWHHGGGGTAYVGWERSYDCLMVDVTTWRMRHAPLVQWAAAGNVIRRGTFHGSDAQWHAGWTNENLFEQCVVDARGKTGSYGHGAYSTPPRDRSHGPNGPRNVVYNCDVHGVRSGLWMGGMNENWLILHNRFVVGAGPGIHASSSSFDHLIRGNAIVLNAKGQAGLRLKTRDCVGIEFVGNSVYGADAQLLAGEGRPLIDQDNRVLPLSDAAPRPQPGVPSIFEWQRRQADR